jgi:hypothetical protein
MVEDLRDGVVRIRIAADYSAFPAWPDSPEARHLRIPDDLNLSSGLLADLQTWAAVHDSARTPPSYSWNDSVASEPDWIGQGRRLAARVQAELGEGYSVVYPYA